MTEFSNSLGEEELRQNMRNLATSMAIGHGRITTGSSYTELDIEAINLRLENDCRDYLQTAAAYGGSKETDVLNWASKYAAVTHLLLVVGAEAPIDANLYRQSGTEDFLLDVVRKSIYGGAGNTDGLKKSASDYFKTAEDFRRLFSSKVEEVLRPTSDVLGANLITSLVNAGVVLPVFSVENYYAEIKETE